MSIRLGIDTGWYVHRFSDSKQVSSSDYGVDIKYTQDFFIDKTAHPRENSKEDAATVKPEKLAYFPSGKKRRRIRNVG